MEFLQDIMITNYGCEMKPHQLSKKKKMKPHLIFPLIIVHSDKPRPSGRKTNKLVTVNLSP